MLQRHVDILDDLGEVCDRVEQLGADEIRIAIEEPYPAEILDGGEFAQEGRE